MNNAGEVEHAAEESSGDPQPSNLPSENHLRYLLSLYENDRLVDLIVQISTKIPDANEEIRNALNADPESRELFVYSLNPITTSQTLRAAFSSFGEIENAVVIKNRQTGRSRCFGFITFKNLESAQEALKNPTKMIDDYPAGYTLACERYMNTSSRKLYVGRLDQDVSKETLISHFSKYGEVVDVYVVYHKETNKSKGYGFVTFKTAWAARKATCDQNKLLGEKKIIVEYTNWSANHQRMPQQMQTEAVPVPASYAAYQPYYTPYAIARPHHYGGNDPYGMPPTGISGYPYYT